MHAQKNQTRIKTSLYRNIALSFIILSIAIAATIFYVTFSWATIIVSPQRIPFSDSYDVNIWKKPTSLADESLFGRVVQTSLDGEGTFSSSGKELKTQKARGSVIIVNNTAKHQPLRATTRLLTSDGFLFRTESFADVPAKGQISVPVIADKAGAIEGADLSRFTIPGLWQGLQSSIYGQYFTLSSKGEDEVSFVTQEDIDRAKSEVLQKLKDKFSLLLGIPDAQFQNKKGVNISDVSVKEFSSSHAALERAVKFTVKMNILAQGVVFDESESMPFIKQHAQNQLGMGYEFVFGGQDSVSYTLEQIDPIREEAKVRFDVTASKSRSQDESQFVKSNLVGLAKDQIKKYFASYGDIEQVDVRFYPFWVQRAPLLTDHIHILFQK